MVWYIPWVEIVMFFLLPFMFLFAVTHGIFSRVQLFGKTHVSTKVHLILSLVFASTGVVLLNRGSFLMTWIVVLGLIVFAFFLLMVIAGFSGVSMSSKAMVWSMVALVVLIGGYVLERVGIFTRSNYQLVLSMLGVVGVMFAVLWWMFRPAKEAKPAQEEKKKTETSKDKAGNSQEEQRDELDDIVDKFPDHVKRDLLKRGYMSVYQDQLARQQSQVPPGQPPAPKKPK